MDHPIRYCLTDDGVRIAYSVEGSGFPLLFAVGWPLFIEHDEELAEARAFLEGVRRNRTLIRYDQRGMGASQREVDDVSIEPLLRDMDAVVRASGIERFDVFGGAGGANVAAVWAALHPTQVERLVLWQPRPRFEPPTDDATQAVLRLMRDNWPLARRTMANVLAPQGTTELHRWANRAYREGLTPEIALKGLTSPTDISAFLPRIQAPTLIVHPRAERQSPISQAREAAALIPGARLLTIEGESALFYLYHEALLSTLATFLWPERDERPRSDHTTGGIRAVLFTDLVGHTEMMQRLGDDLGRDLLREHERITRDVLQRHGGAEVKTLGDGFMASFGSVTKAMDCAIALQQACAAHTESMPEPLHVRIGLNAGEPIEEDGDLFGSMVILASRVCAQAAAGEILIPEPLRHLLSGKTYVYSDRGETILKGFEDAVRLYQVRWRD